MNRHTLQSNEETWRRKFLTKLNQRVMPESPAMALGIFLGVVCSSLLYFVLFGAHRLYVASSSREEVAQSQRFVRLGIERWSLYGRC